MSDIPVKRIVFVQVSIHSSNGVSGKSGAVQIDTAISLSTRGHFRILKSGHFNFLLTYWVAGFSEIRRHHCLGPSGGVQFNVSTRLPV